MKDVRHSAAKSGSDTHTLLSGTDTNAQVSNPK